MWNIDADPRDADWIKVGRWDLPTDPDAFLRAIGGPGRLAAFLRRPAAEAMPPDLRRAVLDSLSTDDLLSLRRKYSPDQPRDDHGRWTVDGVSGEIMGPGPERVDLGDHSAYRQADGTLTRWPDLATAKAEYTAAHPGTVLDLSPDIKPVEAMAALDQVDKLQNRFPGVPITAIRTLTAGDAAQAESRNFAAWCRYGPGGTSEIGLAPNYWLNSGKGSLYWPNDGFHPPGTGDPQGIVTHEFGHAVDHYLDQLYTDNSQQHYDDWPDQNPGEHAAFNGMWEAKSWASDVSRDASGYGRTSSTENFAEWFASAYSAMNHDGSTYGTDWKGAGTSGSASEFRSTLSRLDPVLVNGPSAYAGLYARAANAGSEWWSQHPDWPGWKSVPASEIFPLPGTKYSPDQPRDERGRWSAEGGAEQVRPAIDRNLYDAPIDQWADEAGRATGGEQADVLRATMDLSGGEAASRQAYKDIVRGLTPQQTLFYGPTLAFNNRDSTLAACSRVADLQRQFNLGPQYLREVTADNLKVAGADYNPETGVMRLADRAFGKDPAAFADFMMGETPGWLVDPTPGGVATHEFGHAVAARMLSTQGGMASYWDLADAAAGLSGYASTKMTEAFAEGFTAAFSPGNRLYDSPVAQRFRDALRPSASKYSESEPRVPAGEPGGGQWTADGAGPGGEIRPLLQTAKPPRAGDWATQDPTRMANLPPEYRAALEKQVLAQFGVTPDQMDANLRAVMDRALADPAVVANKDWYASAHDVAAQIAADNPPMTVRTAVGAIAAMSPQHEWGSNAATTAYVAAQVAANPVIDLTDQQKADVNAELAKRGLSLPDEVNGMHLADLTVMQQASVVKAMGRDVPVTYQNDQSGKTMKATWSCGLAGISTAIDILRGGDPDQELSGHKVRSFFNNILTGATNPGGFVTIDTHAISAALGQRDDSGDLVRVPSGDKRISKMMSTPSNAAYGTGGAYPVFADAYRRVASEYSLSPEQAQAVIWLEWRRMTKP